MKEILFRLKQWYLEFLEKDERSFHESIVYAVLYLLSQIYGLAVASRNFLYDKRIIPAYLSSAKVISLGNLCWSGSGKTSLSIWLYKQLSPQFKVAILRRGYGGDEERLIKEATGNVFSFPDRCSLAKKLEASFEVFILDDGFQYRKLRRNIDIIVMGAREFRIKYRLIPANFFREPFSSLKRAGLLVLSYADEINDTSAIESYIRGKVPGLKIYFSRYHFDKITDLYNNVIEVSSLKAKKMAALAAIGYPQGFFNKLKELDLNITKEIIYPDHCELSQYEFDNISDSLAQEGIFDLIITRKDRYHLPSVTDKINIFILNVKFEIDNKDDFLRQIAASLNILNQ